jgi:hypothetical protein
MAFDTSPEWEDIRALRFKNKATLQFHAFVIVYFDDRLLGHKQ